MEASTCVLATAGPGHTYTDLCHLHTQPWQAMRLMAGFAQIHHNAIMAGKLASGVACPQCAQRAP